MGMKKLQMAAVSLLAAAGITATAGGAAFASSPSHEVPESQAYVSGNDQWKFVNNGHEVIDNQVFGPDVHNTLHNKADGPNFTLSRSDTPTFSWNAWPTIFYGCWYNVCSQHRVLPEPVSHIHSIWLTDRTYFPSHGSGNDAMDFWFNKTPTKTASQHPDGAEIMIWTRWRNVSLQGAHLIRLPGHTFWFATWTAHVDGTSWTYLQFRLYHQNNNFTNFNADILLKYCIEHGYIKSSWWATAFDNGFEDIQGMQGAQISQFTIRGF
jgi:hypothetical protein